MRRSSVLSLPLQLVFLECTFMVRISRMLAEHEELFVTNTLAYFNAALVREGSLYASSIHDWKGTTCYP